MGTVLGVDKHTVYSWEKGLQIPGGATVLALVRLGLADIELAVSGPAIGRRLTPLDAA